MRLRLFTYVLLCAGLIAGAVGTIVTETLELRQQRAFVRISAPQPDIMLEIVAAEEARVDEVMLPNSPFLRETRKHRLRTQPVRSIRQRLAKQFTPEYPRAGAGAPNWELEDYTRLQEQRHTAFRMAQLRARPAQSVIPAPPISSHDDLMPYARTASTATKAGPRALSVACVFKKLARYNAPCAPLPDADTIQDLATIHYHAQRQGYGHGNIFSPFPSASVFQFPPFASILRSNFFLSSIRSGPRPGHPGLPVAHNSMSLQSRVSL